MIDAGWSCELLYLRYRQSLMARLRSTHFIVQHNSTAVIHIMVTDGKLTMRQKTVQDTEIQSPPCLYIKSKSMRPNHT